MKIMIWAFALAFCLLCWVGVLLCFSEEVNIEKIISLESSGEAGVYNVSEKAAGLMQIRQGCLQDWNMSHWREQYDTQDLFDPDVNVKIGTWYINKKIPMYLKFYKLEDTIDNRLMAYNWGIGNLRKHHLDKSIPIPQVTKDYLKKYRRLK